MRALAVGMMVCDIPISPVPLDVLELDYSEIAPPKAYCGGDALNVANTLAKLGVNTSVIGRVGLDANGAFLIESAEKNGVNTDGVVRDERHPTAVSYILIDETGERHSLSSTAIFQALASQDVPDSAIEKTDIVYFGSAFLMEQMDNGGTLDLFKRAHRYGKTTIMDTSLGNAQKTRHELWDLISETLGYTDIFLPSLYEARYLTGCEQPHDIAEKLKKYSIKILGIKMGARGSFITDFENQYYISPFGDFPVVDTTGAGDSFVGGFIRAYLNGWDPKQCATFASAVAAHNIRAYGASNGIPAYENIISFLDGKRLISENF